MILDSLEKEIKIASDLRARGINLIDNSNNGVEIDAKRKKEYEDILGEMTKFEKHCTTIEPLYFIYNTIAYCFLDIEDFDMAHSYGLAFYLLTKEREDKEGMTIANDFMVNFCASTLNDNKLEMYLNESKNKYFQDLDYYDVRFDMLENMRRFLKDSEIEPVFNMEKSKKPQSYKFLSTLTNEEEKTQERAIRSLMNAMGDISRSQAIEYIKLANQRKINKETRVYRKGEDENRTQ